MSLLKRITGLPYELMMSLRRKCYSAGLLESTHIDVPVICVGNITTGGTGKTPMVAWVLERLKNKGLSPAILTRGYKAVNGKSDEAELLRSLTGTDVIVNPNRIEGAKTAIANGADILVMDDGYQHLKLQRDFNIVLIDASNPFGGGCLPLGRGREGLPALLFADAIVITRSDTVAVNELESLKRKLAKYCSGPITAARHQPIGFLDLQGNRMELNDAAGKKAMLFCGLGNPNAFFTTAKSVGLDIVTTKALGDHAHYDVPAIDKLLDEFSSSGAELLVTTTKDGVKLLPESFGDTSVWQLEIQMQLDEPDFLDHFIIQLK